MRHAFDCWPEIVSRVRAAGSVTLFLDFDGTLTPLRPRPDQVMLSYAARMAVARLAGDSRTRVWVISGRKLADIRQKTDVSGVRYLGLHGWEGQGRSPLDAQTMELLRCIRQILARRLAGLPGIWIEDKEPIFAIHYRGAVSENEVAQARAAVYQALAPHAGSLRALAGNRVWEILPWSMGDKGKAVRLRLRQFGGRSAPLYLGDDETDEPAFRALSEGITVRVGRYSPTHAKLQLRDPAEVLDFLERLHALLHE